MNLVITTLYYINDIPQGFEEPSFYVRLLDSSFNLI